jgi:hypothetical protein
MSDIHHLPLVGHDLEHKPEVRAMVYSYQSLVTGATRWYWKYDKTDHSLIHGPFESWREAYESAYRMVTLL